MACIQEDLATLHRSFALTRDPRLREELITQYDRLAVHLGKRFSTRRESTDDLIQVARVGLINAVDRFDPEIGCPFVAFARSTILGHLKRHIRDRTWDIRPPRRLQEHYLVVVRTRDELTQILGRSPTIPEVAERAGLTDEEVLDAVEVMHSAPVSLDHSLEADSVPVQLGREDSGYSRVEATLLVESVAQLVGDLDRKILQLRFEEELAQAEIGLRIGRSQMYVSRSLTRILERLRIRLAAERAEQGAPVSVPPPP